MNQLSDSIHRFFSTLTIGADEHDGHHYKDFIEESIDRFLRAENKETAYDVYQVFLDSYGYAVAEQNISFLQLLEKMRLYEENAAVLTTKQRDHFVHSVNVFLIGLAVYQSNAHYRRAFYDACFRGSLFHGKHDSAQEEFFFRWGIASLCHDIGYPIEIITNQVNDFINFTTQLRTLDKRIFAHVEYDHFERVNTIPEEIKKSVFIQDYYARHDSCVYIDLLKPVDLLAHKLHLTLGVDLQDVKERLDGYVEDSGRSGRVDHGFFSAVILLKWYGYLIQVAECSPDQLFYPILDSASAILLHNFYGVALVANTKRPNAFSLPPMRVQQHPIAWLLILCDELQEWNREPYGEQDRVRTFIGDASISMEAERLDVTYLIDKGTMSEEFVGKKMGTINGLLDVAGVFPKGFSVGTHLLLEMPVEESVPQCLTMNQLERLAIAIHNRHNRIALELNPAKKIKYQNFSDLPRDRKFYNMRGAMHYPAMLRLIGCEIRPKDDANDEILVTAFTDAEVEVLAKAEHDRWMAGRAERGWVYGIERNQSKKINPYLVPYEQLTEEIKELDRRPAREIPTLLGQIGLGVYREKPEEFKRFTEDEIDILARRIHGYYNERTAMLEPDTKLYAFDELTEEKKNANRRQARGIPNKLRHIHCMLLPEGTKDHGEPVTVFSPEVVEMLARIEHDEWMGEKIANGWRYGEVRDEEKKTNPYITDYDRLSQEVREYDRDAVRNMPVLAKACGYEIFRKD